MTVPKLLQQAESLLFGENVQMPEILPIQSQISFTRVYFWLYYLYICTCNVYPVFLIIFNSILFTWSAWSMIHYGELVTMVYLHSRRWICDRAKIFKNLLSSLESPESKKATKINWCEQHWTKLSIIIVQNFN